MNIQRIQWKVFIQDMAGKEPDDFFAAFSTWIPDSPEVFIDVSDYKHVGDGTLLWLAGYHVSYSLDVSEGQAGILYTANRPLEGTEAEKIAASFEAVLTACRRLEADPRLSGLKFDTAAPRFYINDRAIAPNTPETLASVKPELEKALSGFYPVGVELSHATGDGRERFSIQVRGGAPALFPTVAG